MSHSATPPIPPDVMASVSSSWRRIVAWLAGNAPDLAGKMHPGATPEAIAQVEASMGIKLPDAVRASYLLHDGSGIIRLFPPGFYLTLEQMASQGAMMRQNLEEGWFEGLEYDPKGPIRKVSYHPSWIPLTDNGGNFTFVDLEPDDGGVIGQLVNFGRETGPEDVAASGVAEYLEYLADGLEAGAAKIGEGSYLDWHAGGATSRSSYVLPSRAG